jgi:RecJ-like exonuclease
MCRNRRKIFSRIRTCRKCGDIYKTKYRYSKVCPKCNMKGKVHGIKPKIYITRLFKEMRQDGTNNKL